MANYTITAPVVLIRGNATEEEPYRAHVAAPTKEEGVRLFQQEAWHAHVDCGTYTAVDFYPFDTNAEKYDIIEQPSPVHN